MLGIYRHYKGGIYQVIALAKCSETKEELVIYTGESGTWARPRTMFEEMVTHEGKRVARFELVEEEVPAITKILRVKELRDRTSLSLMICKNALERNKWNVDAAHKYLKAQFRPPTLINPVR